MFDLNVCGLRSSMVLCDLFTFKMYLLTLKIIFIRKSRNVIYYLMYTLLFSLCLSLGHMYC